MAAAASHEHHQNTFLPPSPPPSPSAARRRHKKYHDDEFAKLAATPLPSPTLSATFDEDKPEPLLKRIFLTPLLFTSFLLSLFLVNAQDRARRRAAHTSPSSYLTFLFPSWIDPEPYQDHEDSTWGRRAASKHVEPNITIRPRPEQLDGITGAHKRADERKEKRKNSWHLNKKIRKITRLEVSDAFEGQEKVIVVMVVMMVFSIIGSWVGMRWVWRSIFG